MREMSSVGMVFHNPDNQIIGTSVEEDAAFGPENKNIESAEIQKKVTNSLAAVGLLSKRKSSPYKLSGGQKQRVAVAGVLAGDSDCIVFDEPTAMLDPVSRREVMDIIRSLHEAGKTIILITHHTDEAASADRIILMDRGRVAAFGTPQEIFSKPELLRSVGMELPPVAELSEKLKAEKVIDAGETLLTKEDLVRRILEKKNSGVSIKRERSDDADLNKEAASDADVILELRDLKYTYARGTVNEMEALKGVSLCIHEGECIGLIGPSGAGKSTLAKNLNGLLKAESGDVLYRGESIYRKGFRLSSLRKDVGLVFQNSDMQLFCKTVLDDVAFGPRRMGMSDEEAFASAREALLLVGIGEEYWSSGPVDLSGGQKKRVALAGVLSMKPSVLVLDEPAAGLDPGMKAEIFGIIDRIRREKGTAVILVSHEMEDVARYSDRVMLLSDGTVKLSGTPRELFGRVEELRASGADVPAVTDVMYELDQAGLGFDSLEVETDAAARAIAKAIAAGGEKR